MPGRWTSKHSWAARNGTRQYGVSNRANEAGRFGEPNWKLQQHTDQHYNHCCDLKLQAEDLGYLVDVSLLLLCMLLCQSC